MASKVLVPIADGTEEIEAACIIDVLRRAGADVTMASVNGLQVTCSRGVRLVADSLLADCAGETYDLIVLPGGMPGAERLRDAALLTEMLKRQRDAGKYYAAICASPAVVLEHHGLLEGRRATCHPNTASLLKNREAVEERVVVDGACITSRAPGTALEFALTLVEVLFGKEKAAEVTRPLLVSLPA